MLGYFIDEIQHPEMSGTRLVEKVHNTGLFSMEFGRPCALFLSYRSHITIASKAHSDAPSFFTLFFLSLTSLSCLTEDTNIGSMKEFL